MSDQAAKNDLDGSAANGGRPKYLFITGRLAESVVRRTVAKVAEDVGFDADVNVLGITVAALLHADWITRRLPAEDVVGYDRVYLPGWVQGDAAGLSAHYGVPFELGPKDIVDLPRHFGRAAGPPPDLTRYDIEILAEINHAPRLSLDELLRAADRYRDSGGDVIDVGCIPGDSWREIGGAVMRLVADGHRVSVDSFDRDEVAAALDGGAELVLSCNGTNADWLAPLAADRGAEVVVIPDDPHELGTLYDTADRLQAEGVRYRLDAILEPIGFGFAASLARYFEVRRRRPDAAMMMGVGNLTEMTEVDSAGVNVLLAAVCQELRIGSVLTTEVIHWGQSAVREFDLARRLVRHAVENQTVPKHVSDDLVVLRSGRAEPMGEGELVRLAESLKDPNYRVFVEGGEIHVMNRDGHWRGQDAYELFDTFSADAGLSADHAFYLGYELCKAVTALTLSKRYVQDEALGWGFLTVNEPSAKERRRHAGRPSAIPLKSGTGG